MALHKPVELNAATAQQLLSTPKSLEGAILRWERIQTPGGRPTGGQRMKTTLEALGERLEILCSSNGYGGHQYVLRHSSAAGNLARLCDNRSHNHELHWHRLEDMPGLMEEVVEVTPARVGGPDADASTLFVEVFAKDLHIDPTSYTVQEAML